MNEERAILKGYLAEAKQEKMKLETEISSRIRSVRTLLAGFEFKPISRVDIEGASAILVECVNLKRQLTEVSERIDKLREDLE